MGTIADLCDVDRKTIAPGNARELRYLGLEHVESGRGTILGTSDAPKSTTFAFGSQHVLYGKLRPYLNKVALPEFAGCCTTELIPLRPKPGVEREYLWYALRRPALAAAATAMNTGTQMPRADMAVVMSFPTPVPTKDEQRRIVDLLSRAEGIVRLRRDAEKKAAELVPALFIDMFGDPGTNPKGWSEMALRQAVSEFRYGSSSKSGATGLPTLRIPNVIGDRLDPGEIKLVSVSDAEGLRLRLRRGDLLLVRSNGNPDYVGRSAVFDPDVMQRAGYDGDRCIYASYLIRARLNQDLVNPWFVQSFLSSFEGRMRLREQARTSAGQYNINSEGLSAIRIMAPPITLQNEFELRCRQVNSIRELQRAAFAVSEFAFASLLTRTLQ